MNFGSVCSGIEAASAAWHPLGWTTEFLSEIEQFPSAVLAHHYPDVPNLGDMTKFKEWPDAAIDVLVGGTPCQSFSVAGLRKGLDDPRGNLMLTYLAIADRYRPKWLVWENVPGVLSSNGGRDFGTFLGGLGQLGYGFAYRVLDAQYFGVPQRRRRVFVVGCLGEWRAPAAVLFERHGLQWNTPPRREAGEGFATDVAPSLTASGRGVERTGETRGQDPVVAQPYRVANCLTARTAKGVNSALNEGQTPVITQYGPVAGSLTARHDSSPCADRGQNIVAVHGTQDPCVSDQAFALGRNNGQENAVVQSVSIRGREGGASAELSGEVATVLRASQGGGDKPHVLTSMRVRRLTPVECERLQGFPDDYTRIPWKGGYWPADKHSPEIRAAIAEQCPDGPRYKALGNSMAVPVMRWIGERIKMVSEVIAE